LLYPNNLSEHVSLDETALSYDELYSVLSNKEGKGKQGSLIAIIKGTKSSNIIDVVSKIPLVQREKVKEVSIDMARNMEKAAKELFPKAKIITDRFHVVKLITEVLQHVRIKYRWKAIDKENNDIAEAKGKGNKYKPIILSNGDTHKELLAKSRYLLFRDSKKWTELQQERAEVLFKEYPIISKFYHFVMKFRNIYEEQSYNSAKFKLENWLNEAECTAITEIRTFIYTVRYNLENILNFFINRNTNAFAESFNSKIKHFRANLRGVKNIDFFLFRLDKLFA
jgi:transposase